MNNCSQISLKAILAGILVDIGGTISGSLFIVYFLSFQMLPSLSTSTPTVALQKILEVRAPTIALIVLSLAFTFLGGFTSAHFTGSAQVMNSGLAGFVKVLYGLLSWVSNSLYFNLIQLFLTIPIAMFGGYLVKSRYQKSLARQEYLSTVQVPTRHHNIWLLGIISLAVITSAIFYITQDEPLSHEVKAWMQRDEQDCPPEDNGYFTLMGFFAAQDDDPHEVGFNRIQEYETKLILYNNLQEEFLFDDYPESRKLTIPEEVQSYQDSKTRCLSVFSEQAKSIQGLSRKYKTLLDRYHSLYNYPCYHVAATPSYCEPQINCGQFHRAHQLLIAGIGAEFMTGDKDKAIKDLQRDIEFHRSLLARADSVIFKLMIGISLRQDIYLYAELLDKYGADAQHGALSAVANDLATLAPLTEEERSISKPIRQEFQTTAWLFSTMGKSDILRRWRWHKVMYKPQASINRLYFYYQLLAELGELDGQTFARQLDSKYMKRPGFLDYIHNPLGIIFCLAQEPKSAEPFREWHITKYIAAQHDLDGLIRLVQLKQLTKAADVKKEQVAFFIKKQGSKYGNPYTGEPMQWDPERQVLYFDGPIEANKYMPREISVPFSPEKDN